MSLKRKVKVTRRVKITDNGRIFFKIDAQDPLIDDFLHTLSEVYNYSQYTVYHYQRTLNTFYNFLTEEKGKNLLEVTTKDVEEFIASKKLKRVSIKGYISDLKIFYDYLEENGSISKTPINKRLSKAFRNLEKSEKKPFSKEEIEVIRKTLENAPIMWRAITEVFLSSGLRLKELAMLNFGDISLKTRIIRVREGKGGKSRITFMSTLASELLSYYLLTTRKIRGRGKNLKALFVSMMGKRLSMSAINNFYLKLSKKFNIHIHPHKFRHTFASMLAEAGTDFICLQKLLGHSTSLGETDRYTHLSEERLFREYSKAFK